MDDLALPFLLLLIGLAVLVLATGMILWLHYLAIRTLNNRMRVVSTVMFAGMMPSSEEEEGEDDRDAVQDFFEQGDVPAGPQHKREG